MPDVQDLFIYMYPYMVDIEPGWKHLFRPVTVMPQVCSRRGKIAEDWGYNGPAQRRNLLETGWTTYSIV